MITRALFLLLLAAFAAEAKQFIVFTGSYTRGNSKGVYSYGFDSATGRLTPIGLAGETPNPSYIVIHSNRRWLYAANELPNGTISAFRIEGSKLTPINVVSGNGAVTCYLSIDKTGKYLLAANYTGGNVGSFPIRADGSLGEAITMIKHEGSGPHARQRQPHAHSINISQNNRWAVAADLGTDRLYINGFDGATGVLTARPEQAAKLKPGSGPRHFAFHPNRRLAFSINEIASTLTSWRFDESAGTLMEIQTETTLPAGFSGENTTAEVVVHPNGKWVYGSNRGHHSIAVFQVDPASGKLSARGQVSSGGAWPRNFNIDPTGHFMIVANERSDSLVVFRINPANGDLTPTGVKVDAGAPVCVKFLTAK